MPSVRVPRSTAAASPFFRPRATVGAALLALGPAWSGAQTTGAPEPEAQLPSVTVVGRSSSGAYHAAGAEGARTEAPLRELPQSVRVLTRQAVDDLGATRLDEVLDHVGGVSRQNNIGGFVDNIAIRGLPGDESTGLGVLLNGFGGNRGLNVSRDLAAVERVEFLKGPAAALYGSSEPGGVLNIVSKAPRWQAGHALETYVGTQNLRRVALDSTGPLSDTLAYRLNLAHEQRDGFRDHVGSKRQVVAPALTWKVAPLTTVRYVGEFLQQQSPFDRGVPAVRQADGRFRLGAVPRSRFLGEPADGDVALRDQTHQWSVEHEWNADWRTRVATSARHTDLEGASSEARLLQSDGLMRRQRRERDWEQQDLGLQAELLGRWQVAGQAHESVFGVETYRFRFEEVQRRFNPTAGNPYAIDIYNPVYGQAQPVPLPFTDRVQRRHGRALYAQDVWTVAPQWRVMLGLRLDDAGQSTHDRRSTAAVPHAAQRSQAWSHRAGVSWLPDANWTVYANTGRSFRPNDGTSQQGRMLTPERGTAYELGTKWERSDRKLGATAALFDIRKRNVKTADPTDTSGSFFVSAGEVRSRGAELDVSGQLSRHWRVSGALAYNEVEVTRDNLLKVGETLLNVPRLTGSVLAVFEGVMSGGQRYSLGGGFTHVSDRLGKARTQTDTAPAFRLPSYTVAKVVGHVQLTPNVKLTLDIDNVFDKTYYTSSYSDLWVTPGSPRAVTVGAQVRF
ncbi:MAG: TonB-dependent siderophore receptor [Aquabacterium sp.]